MTDKKLEELKTRYLLFRTSNDSKNTEKHKKILKEFYDHIKEKREQSDKSDIGLKSLISWLETKEIYDLEKRFDEGDLEK